MICMSRLCNLASSCGRSKRPVRCLIWEGATCARPTVWPSGSWHSALPGLLHQICFWSACRKLQCALQRCLYKAPGLTPEEFLFWFNFCCWWTLRSLIQTLFLMTRFGREVSELFSISVRWFSWISDSQKKHLVESLFNGSQAEHRRTLWLAHAGRNEHGQRQSRDGRVDLELDPMTFSARFLNLILLGTFLRGRGAQKRRAPFAEVAYETENACADVVRSPEQKYLLGARVS